MLKLGQDCGDVVMIGGIDLDSTVLFREWGFRKTPYHEPHRVKIVIRKNDHSGA